MNPLIRKLQVGLPFLIFGLSLLMLGGKFFFPKTQENGFDLASYGNIPVQQGGRIKPLDSLARSTLMVISGKTEVVEVVNNDRWGWLVGGTSEKKLASASAWLLDVWTRPDIAHKYRIFRIDHPEILALIGLPGRPGSYRYSIKELEEANALQKIMPIYQKAQEKEKESRDAFDNRLIELGRHFQIYQALMSREEPGFTPPADDIEGKWTSIEQAINQVIGPFRERFEQAIRERHLQTLLADEQKLKAEIDQVGQEVVMQRIRARIKIETDRQMISLGHQLLSGDSGEEDKLLSPLQKQLEEANPGIVFMAQKIEAAYAAQDAVKFNEAVSEYHAKYTSQLPTSTLGRTNLEARMNAFDPFLQCMALYLGVVLFSCFSWLFWSKSFRQTAFALACLTLVVHTGALVARMYIGNRPPVTNLYSSAIFIGWGALVLCLILEAIYKLGIGTFCAGIIGFLTLIVARYLAESGDTLEMLQAVLDTNFWLATHVTTVTMGYMATLVAGLISIVYIFAALFTNSMRGEQGKQVSGMIYGVICFATLLSFVGTVLGGVWADESWGRFWGWDPKENGAVLIVIWNALVLHARWAGLVKTRGMAFLAVFGNMITIWSWFGTNQLGIGLHAYGADTKLVRNCALSWGLHSVLLLLAFIPSRFWASLGPVKED